jgi:hypothetical protein
MPRLLWTSKPPAAVGLDRGNSLSQGLLACWLLGEGAGSIAKDLAGGYDGNLVGLTAATWKPGNFGGPAPSFAGASYVALSKGPTIPQAAGTVCFWFMPTATLAGDMPLFENRNGTNGFDAYIYNNQFAFGWYTGSSQANIWNISGIAVNTWHFAAITWVSNATLSLYIDGQLKSSFSLPSTKTWATVNSTQFLGHTGASTANAKMECVRIYNRSLNQTEVQRLYTHPFAGLQSPLDPYRLRMIQVLPPAPAIPMKLSGAEIQQYQTKDYIPASYMPPEALVAVSPPISSSSAGVAGQYAVDASYFYVYAAGQWTRSALSAF